MYQADRFLELARRYLEQDIAETTLSEIREVRRRDAQRAAIRRREQELDRCEEYDALRNRENAFRERLASLTSKREELRLHQRLIQESIPDDAAESDQAEIFMSLLPQMRKIEAQIQTTQEEIAAVENSRRHLRRNIHDMRMHGRFIEQESRAFADKPRRSD